MIVANRSPSAGLTLPELDVPPEHIAIRHSTPPDLKGLKYTHLPGLGSDGRSSTSTNDEPVVLLPVLDEPHPFPYIISPSITLMGEALEFEQMQDDRDDEAEMASQYFLLETQFSKEFLEDLLVELLQQDLVEILEAIFGTETEEKETIPEMEAKQHEAVPLENDETGEMAIEAEQEVEDLNFNDEDLDIFIIEFLEIEIDQESRNIIWEHTESLLSEWELTNLSSPNNGHFFSPKLQQTLSLFMAGQAPDDDEAGKLYEFTIDKILFEYHHMLHEQKLEDNEALRHFQNELIGHSLTSLIVRDGLHNLEKDLEALENEERKLYPPRV